MDFFLNEGEKPLKKLETTVFTPKFVYIFQKKQLQRFFYFHSLFYLHNIIMVIKERIKT